MSMNEAAAKARWEEEHPLLPWESLTAGQRQGYVLAEGQPEPESVHGLRAALRKQRIDNGILQRKLDAALAKIAVFEASRELAAALAEDDEPSCP